MLRPALSTAARQGWFTPSSASQIKQRLAPSGSRADNIERLIRGTERKFDLELLARDDLSS